MKFKPNAHYYKVKVTVQKGESVYIAYPKFADFLHLDEGLEVPEFFLSEDQYFQRYDRCLEDHIKAALRRYVETEILGHEKAEVDAEGNVIEETWEWIPGHIEPKDFFMISMPYCQKKVEIYVTDSDGKLRREEDKAYA